MKNIILLGLILLFSCSKNDSSPQQADNAVDPTIDEVSNLVNSNITLTPSASNPNSLQTNSMIAIDYTVSLNATGNIKIDVPAGSGFSLNSSATNCPTSFKRMSASSGSASCQVEILFSSSSLAGGTYTNVLNVYDSVNGLIKSDTINVYIDNPTTSNSTNQSTNSQCKTGYHYELRTCRLDVKSCTNIGIGILTGNQNWNTTNKNYDSCIPLTCYSAGGYLATPINNACVQAVQQRNCSPQPAFSSGGYESSTDGGQTWGACSNFTCSNPYKVSNVNTCELAPVLTNTQTNLLSNGGNITLIGTCEGTLPLVLTETGNTTLNKTCNNGTYAIPYAVVNATSGTKTVTITETRNGISSSVNVSYTLDKVSPTLTFNTLPNIDTTNSSSYTISGTCSSEDVGQPITVTLTDSSFNNVSSNVNCSLPYWTMTSNISTFQDGTVNVQASLTDLAGNNTTIASNATKASVSALYALPIKDYMLIPQNLSTFQNLSLNALTVSASGQLVKTSGNYIYVGTSMGLSISSDNGATWTTKTTANGLASNQILDVAVSGTYVYVGTYRGLSISADNGKTFSSIFLGSRIDSVAASGSNVYAAFANTIRYSRDNGQTFNIYSSTVFSSTESRFIYGSTIRAYGNIVALIGNNSYSIGISFSSDNGQTFTHKYAGSNYRDVGYDSGVVYILSSAGSLSYSLDNLATTGSVSSGFGGVVGNSEMYMNGNDMYVLAFGSLKISHNAGGTWTSFASLNNIATDGYVWGVGVSGSNVYVYHTNGLYISTDGGNSYRLKSATNSIVSNTIKDLTYLNGKLYILTDLGLSVSTDNGKTFSAIGLGFAATIYQLDASPSKLYLATSAGLVISSDGIIFTLMPNSGSIQKIKYANNRIYALRGSIQYSTNDGVSWTALTATQSMSVYNFSVEGNNVYFLDSNGYFRYSTDGGNTFSISNSSNVGVNPCPIITNGNYIFIPTPSNGVYVSSNYGQTFVYKTTTNGLGSNTTYNGFFDGTTIYIGTAGGLSMSTDHGLTYTNKSIVDGISGRTGNSRVKAIYATAPYVFAGTENGLSTSTNNGVSFINRNATNYINPTDVQRVAVKGTNVYVIKNYTLYISNDSGKTFIYSDWLNNYNSNYGVMDLEVIAGDVYVAGYGYNTAIIDSGGMGIFKVNADGTTFTKVVNLDTYYGSTSINSFSYANGKYYIATNNATYGLIIYDTTNSTYSIKTTANGLGSGVVNDVKISGNYVFAATTGGVSVSIDGGNSFANKTTSNGLPSNTIKSIDMIGNVVYAGTDLGLAISSNFTGTILTFTFPSTKTTTDGLINNSINSVRYFNGNLYISTINGLSISANGTTFTNKSYADGFSEDTGSSAVKIYSSSLSPSGKIYFATSGGIITTAQ